MLARISAFALFCFLLSCAEDDASFDAHTFEDDPSIASANGTWKVVSFEDFVLQQSETQTDENSLGEDIVITIDDTTFPHTVSGKNTSNTIAVEFEYIDSRTFSFGSVSSTFINQPEWANKFLVMLSDHPNPFIINKTQLRIYYDNKSKAVTFVRQ